MSAVLAMSEAELQAAAIDLARLLRYRVAHFRPALSRDGRWRTPVAADGAGFPDLVLARRGRLIFAELKSTKGRVSTAQCEWLRVLRTVPCVGVHVWRPEDWTSGAIEAVLR